MHIYDKRHACINIKYKIIEMINKVEEITMESCSSCDGGWITSCNMVIGDESILLEAMN